jgi:hypothetical protein
MEENQRDCWDHAIYSNRPTEGEFKNLFPNLKERKYFMVISARNIRFHFIKPMLRG